MASEKGESEGCGTWWVDFAPVDGHIARGKMDLMGYQKRKEKEEIHFWREGR